MFDQKPIIFYPLNGQLNPIITLVSNKFSNHKDHEFFLKKKKKGFLLFPAFYPTIPNFIVYTISKSD